MKLKVIPDTNIESKLIQVRDCSDNKYYIAINEKKDNLLLIQMIVINGKCWHVARSLFLLSQDRVPFFVNENLHSLLKYLSDDYTIYAFDSLKETLDFLLNECL